MANWKEIEGVYPNGLPYRITGINFGYGIAESYWHVEDGYTLNRWRKNSKVYVNEKTIREVILKKLRKRVRDVGSAIESALQDVS